MDNYNDQYQSEFHEFLEASGEGIFTPTPRTPKQVAARDISIVEDIAVEILRADAHVHGTYDWAESHVIALISDRDCVVQPPADIYKKLELLNGDKYSNIARENQLARLWLADAIAHSRLYDVMGESQRTISLGFGVCVTGSLASAVVDYHKRMIFIGGKR